MTLPRLFALSPGDLTDARAAHGFAVRVRDLVRLGLRGVVLREPELEDGATLALARELRALLPVGQGTLVVHDRVHVALAAAADGVHLGFRSLPVAECRAVLERAGASLAIGLSTHAGDAPASWAGADHLFHGPFAEVTSKPDALPPVGAEGLAAACAAATVPVFALGGIDAANARAALASGVHGLAVRGALALAEDAEEQLAGLLLALSEAAP